MPLLHYESNKILSRLTNFEWLLLRQSKKLNTSYDLLFTLAKRQNDNNDRNTYMFDIPKRIF